MSAFTHPAWLWCLLVLPVLALLFIRAEKLRRIALDALLALRLQPRLAGSASPAKRHAAFTLTLLGIALLVLAMARPSWGFEWQESKSKGRDLVIALDTSRSMLADDLKPNRLTRAKLAAQDLLSQLSGDRVGLIAFAGSAFLQAPLTPDYDAVRDSLHELDTDIIPRGGTDISAAIQTAAEAFGKGESDQRALIIFTDGEDLAENAVTVARDHKDKFRIFTVGLGSADGSLIPTRTRSGGTDFVRDEQGQPVKSRLDEKRLREVAEAGGGFYIHLQNGPAEMRQLIQQGFGTMREKDNENKMSKQPIERFQWPLFGGLLCIVIAVLLGERRRAAKAAALLLLATAPLQAADPGAARFAKQDYKGALEHYETKLQKQDAPELHYNAGIAAYQLGEYDKAATAFSQALGAGDHALQSRAEYNLANTLAKRGAAEKEKEPKTQEWKNALQHYEEALRLDPRNKDAEHNRDLVTTALVQLEKQEQEKKEEEQKKQEGNKDDKKNDQSQDQKDQSQKGEKKDSDGKPQDDAQKGDQEKPADQKDRQQKEGEKKDGEEKKEAEAQAKAAEPEKQKTGDLKAADEGAPSAEKQQQAEAAEAAAAAREGRMTSKDAKTLLDAQKKYDVILPPIKMLQEQQQRQPVRKNW